MRGYFHLFFWFCAGWVALVVVVYRTLGATAPDRASADFLISLGAVVLGGLAALVALVVVGIRDYTSTGTDPGEPEGVPGPPRWDEEFTTGSTGDELEDLGLVKHEPLPSEKGRGGA